MGKRKINLVLFFIPLLFTLNFHPFTSSMATFKKAKLLPKAVESLENDYLVEQVSDNDSVATKTSQTKNHVTTTQPPDQNNKRKKLVSRHNLDNLGFHFALLPSRERIPTYSLLLSKLYLEGYKPLIVKNHTKIKVLVVCASALRVLEVVKDLKTTENLKVAKLFARHIKLPEQLLQLKNDTFHVGVGTPNRILKIMNDDDGIKKDKIEYVIIDGTYRDKKTMSIVDLDDVRSDLKLLNTLFKGSNATFYNY
jgi:hypothetical protein